MQRFIRQIIPDGLKSRIILEIFIGFKLVRCGGVSFNVRFVRRLSILWKLRTAIEVITRTDKLENLIAASERLKIIQQDKRFDLGGV